MPNWPAGHQQSVDALMVDLRARTGWVTAYLDDASGVLVCARRVE